MLLLVPILASVSSSEYLSSLITRGLLLLFLGPSSAPGPPSQDSAVPDFTSMQGTFYLQSSEGFDAYLAELGVGFILRQLAGLAFPIITVSHTCPEDEAGDADCEWTIKTDAGVRYHTLTFLPGQAVDDTTLDGRAVTSTFTLGPGSITEEQWSREGGANTTLVRTFRGSRMEVDMWVNGVNASSVFLRS